VERDGVLSGGNAQKGIEPGTWFAAGDQAFPAMVVLLGGQEAREIRYHTLRWGSGGTRKCG
jgi:hypothetical protein